MADNGDGTQKMQTPANGGNVIGNAQEVKETPAIVPKLQDSTSLMKLEQNPEEPGKKQKPLRPKETVEHPIFGLGVVLEVHDGKASVHFQNPEHGRKLILQPYLTRSEKKLKLSDLRALPDVEVQCKTEVSKKEPEPGEDDNQGGLGEPVAE